MAFLNGPHWAAAAQPGPLRCHTAQPGPSLLLLSSPNRARSHQIPTAADARRGTRRFKFRYKKTSYRRFNFAREETWLAPRKCTSLKLEGSAPLAPSPSYEIPHPTAQLRAPFAYQSPSQVFRPRAYPPTGSRTFGAPNPGAVRCGGRSQSASDRRRPLRPQIPIIWRYNPRRRGRPRKDHRGGRRPLPVLGGACPPSGTMRQAGVVAKIGAAT